MTGPDRTVPRRIRWSLALGLMILSPLCAEYLVGYDDSTGDPLALLGGLFIFIPLYGAPALLIREVARRCDLNWPGILALAAAAGVAQAALIDQSVFSQSYRDIDYWSEMTGPTYLAPLGLSAATTLSFVAGHVIWSFGAPIAVVESFARDRRPWLRAPGLIVAVVLYLLAAAVVLRWHLSGEDDHATAPELIGASAVVLLLVVAAFAFGRRAREPREAFTPRALPLGLGAFVLGLGYQFMPPTWAGVAGSAVLLGVAAVAVARFARSRRWTRGHIAALATGALAASATTGYFADPIGEVSRTAQFAHNSFFLFGVLVLGFFAWRSGRSER
ncbi:hypothetical protein [Phytomonospora endophytica]|uniref:Uncharacterized protein n=1 Tax=Phytomonospora endophytica TaxID=714109 RepID=A0A841FJJ5_9ACTN|nr:hypothetical protein [Phytomonospora endophytica]MBB6034008.1 hypothetical protein [Phytomonospora endophytica]GIG64471.1 hypothetical protein Pen01_07660 [Phytomonospora endophytica]